MINEVELQKFYELANSIRTYGYMLDHSTSWETIKGYTWMYRLKISDSIYLRLEEENFTKRIELIFIEIGETYVIETNLINREVLKHYRHNWDRQYEEKLQDIILLIESELESLDLENAFIDKINHSFEAGFDIDFKGYSSTVVYPSDLSSTNYIKYAQKIAKAQNKFRRIDFLCNPIFDFNRRQVPLNEIMKIIESSNFFINKKNELYEHTGLTMEIIIKNDNLFVEFKSNKW